MSLAQQLLLRALVARFWREPYAPPKLARWGTELHDRFLLPHFIEQDFADVIVELNSAGYPLRAEWFAAHLEFRFPKVGDYAVNGIELELRQALEPWHVLGEEGAAGGTVRYVDSSLERLQVKLKGLPPQRYLLTCNGVAVPLHPTGRVGEFVAGVRLSRVATGQLPATDHTRARTAGVRLARHLDGPFAGRLPIPRRASGRAQLRDLAGQRQRSGEPAHGAFFPCRTHARETSYTQCGNQ
jgi:uncharacterized protein (DUF2126 family)